MFNHKLLKPKDCPVCEKIIYLFDKNGKPLQLNEQGMNFSVLFNDGNNAEFAICKDCYSTITPEQLDKLMQDQIYTWGIEIVNTPLGLLDYSKQLLWYIQTAVFLRIVKWSKHKEEL